MATRRRSSTIAVRCRPRRLHRRLPIRASRPNAAAGHARSRRWISRSTRRSQRRRRRRWTAPSPRSPERPTTPSCGPQRRRCWRSPAARQGRRAAVDGLASIAFTSTVVNAGMKPLRRRQRPDRVAYAVPIARQVEMPLSTSFPSGHAASAFAFATGVARELPTVGIPLHVAAAAVAYSRVHTGVHYPIDVIAGSVFGGSLSPLATTALDRWRVRRAGTPRAMTRRAVTDVRPSATTRPVSDLLRDPGGAGAGRRRTRSSCIGGVLRGDRAPRRDSLARRGRGSRERRSRCA